MSARSRPVLAALALAVTTTLPLACRVQAAESEAVALPGATAGAVVVGWDEPRLVRVVAPEGGHGALLAEAWSGAGGTWRRLGEAAELRRHAAPSELIGFTARLADAEGRVPVTGSDHLRLLSVAVAGRERRAVAVTSVFVSATCCTSFTAVDVRRGRVLTTHLAERLPPVDTVLAIDLDGDGADELLTRTPARSATGSNLVAYGWRDGRFVELAKTEVPEGMRLPPFVLGETDGRPGDEAGLLDHAGLGRLGRVSLGEGAELAVEVTGLLAPRDPREDITGVAAMPDGRLAIATGGASYLGTWPAGSRLDVVAEGHHGGSILGILAAPLGARLVTRHPITTELAAMDADLEDAALDVPRRRVGRSAWLPQYTGPVPGESGPQAVVAGDVWIEPAAIELAVRPSIRFAGAHPLALAGGADAWLVLLRSLDRRAQSASGGPLRDGLEWLDDRLSAVPLRSVADVAAERHDVDEWLSLHDAAILEHAPGDAGDLVVAVAGAGFAVELDAAPGSIVHLQAGGELTTYHVADEPLTLTLPADREARALVAVVEPNAHSSSARITVGEVVSGAPRLHVHAVTPLLSPRVVVAGRTAPSADVRVDGRPVAVGDDGRFRVSVEAAALPRKVAVDAVDPLGTATEAELWVVAYVDYLRAPWPAFLATGLLALGALAAWRRPPQTSRAADGELADLEEFDEAG